MALSNLETDQQRLFRIFMPHAYERGQYIRSQGKRLVHYTSAEAAMNILRHKEVWMRKTSCMIDYMEVQHGLNFLYKVYRETEVGKKFKSALSDIFEEIPAEIERIFDILTPNFLMDTYVVCFSEHEDSEDMLGRLSMWRAYSETTGVALVLNNEPFFTPSRALKAYSSPVAYLDYQELEAEIGKVAFSIVDDQVFLRKQERRVIINCIINTLRFAVVCAKHAGFKEEKEWRVIYSPSIEKSEYIKQEIKVIRGIPQPICKIPLQDIPEEGLNGIEIPSLINRIIIGPSQYPMVLHEAFYELLSQAGAKEPQQKVVFSNIPLRQ